MFDSSSLIFVFFNRKIWIGKIMVLKRVDFVMSSHDLFCVLNGREKEVSRSIIVASLAFVCCSIDFLTLIIWFLFRVQSTIEWKKICCTTYCKLHNRIENQLQLIIKLYIPVFRFHFFFSLFSNSKSRPRDAMKLKLKSKREKKVLHCLQINILKSTENVTFVDISSNKPHSSRHIFATQWTDCMNHFSAERTSEWERSRGDEWMENVRDYWYL